MSKLGSVIAAKKAQKEREEVLRLQEIKMYGHLDEISASVLKAGRATGIKTDLDIDITKEPPINDKNTKTGTKTTSNNTINKQPKQQQPLQINEHDSQNYSNTSFDVDGLIFKFSCIRCNLDESFSDIYKDVLCPITEKVYNRAILARESNSDRGRSHSRILPLIVSNISTDPPKNNSINVPSNDAITISLETLNNNNDNSDDSMGSLNAPRGNQSPKKSTSLPNINQKKSNTYNVNKNKSIGSSISSSSSINTKAQSSSKDQTATAALATASTSTIIDGRLNPYIFTLEPTASLFFSLGAQNGNLGETIRMGRRMTVRNVVKWAFQILNTMHYWHVRFFTLGTLTADDIVLTSDKSILVSTHRVLPEPQLGSRAKSRESKSRDSKGGTNRKNNNHSNNNNDNNNNRVGTGDSERTDASGVTDTTTGDTDVDHDLDPEELENLRLKRERAVLRKERETIELQRKFQTERDAWIDPLVWLRNFEAPSHMLAYDQSKSVGVGDGSNIIVEGDNESIDTNSVSSSSTPNKITFNPSMHPSTVHDTNTNAKSIDNYDSNDHSNAIKQQNSDDSGNNSNSLEKRKRFHGTHVLTPTPTPANNTNELIIGSLPDSPQGSVDSINTTVTSKRRKPRCARNHFKYLKKYENSMKAPNTANCIVKSRDLEKITDYSRGIGLFVKKFEQYNLCVREDLRSLGHLIFRIMLRREPSIGEARILNAERGEALSFEDCKELMNLSQFPKCLQDILCLCLSKEGIFDEPLTNLVFEETLTEFKSPIIERMKQLIKPLAKQVQSWESNMDPNRIDEDWTEDDEYQRLQVIFEYREKMDKEALEGRIRAEKRVRYRRYQQWLWDQPQAVRDEINARKQRRVEAEKQSKERLYLMHFATWHAWDATAQLQWMKNAIRAYVLKAHELAKKRRKSRLDAYQTDELMCVIKSLQPIEKHVWTAVGRRVKIPSKEEIIESKKPKVGGRSKIVIPTKAEIEEDKKRMLRGFADILAKAFCSISRRFDFYLLNNKIKWALEEAQKDIDKSALLQVLKPHQKKIKKLQLAARAMSRNFNFLQQSTIKYANSIKMRDRIWPMDTNFMIAIAVIEKWIDEEPMRLRGEHVAAAKMQGCYRSDKARRVIKRVMVLAEVEIKKAAREAREARRIKKEQDEAAFKAMGITDEQLDEIKSSQEEQSLQNSSMFDKDDNATIESSSTKKSNKSGKSEKELEVERSKALLADMEVDGISERKQLAMIALQSKQEEAEDAAEEEAAKFEEELKEKFEIIPDPTDSTGMSQARLTFLVKLRLSDWGVWLYRKGKLQFKVTYLQDPDLPPSDPEKNDDDDDDDDDFDEVEFNPDTDVDGHKVGQRKKNAALPRIGAGRMSGSGALGNINVEALKSHAHQHSAERILGKRGKGTIRSVNDGRMTLIGTGGSPVPNFRFPKLDQNGEDYNDNDDDDDDNVVANSGKSKRKLTMITKKLDKRSRATTRHKTILHSHTHREGATRSNNNETARLKGRLVLSITGDPHVDNISQSSVNVEPLRARKLVIPPDRYVSMEMVAEERAYELLPKNAEDYGKPPSLEEKLNKVGWVPGISKYTDDQLKNPMLGFIEATTGKVIGGISPPSSPLSRPLSPAVDWDLNSFGILNAHETFESMMNNHETNIENDTNGNGGSNGYFDEDSTISFNDTSNDGDTTSILTFDEHASVGSNTVDNTNTNTNTNTNNGAIIKPSEIAESTESPEKIYENLEGAAGGVVTQRQLDSWQGKHGSKPEFEDKWRYFRVRIDKLYAARDYIVLPTVKRSLVEMTSVADMDVSLDKMLELETKTTEAKIFIREQSSSGALRKAALELRTADCSPEPPIVNNKGWRYCVSKKSDNTFMNKLTSRNKSENNTRNDDMNVDNIDGSDERILNIDRLLFNMSFRAGYSWEQTYILTDIQRRIVPIPTPSYRKYYANLVKQLELEEDERSTSSTKRVVRALEVLHLDLPDVNHPSYRQNQTMFNTNSSNNGINNDISVQSDTASIASVSVSNSDMMSIIGTLPEPDAISYTHYRNNVPWKTVATLEPHIRTYSEMLPIKKLVSTTLQSIDILDRVYYSNVTISGEGLEVQYRMRTKTCVGYSSFTHVASFPIDDRLNSILRIDPQMQVDLDKPNNTRVEDKNILALHQLDSKVPNHAGKIPTSLILPSSMVLEKDDNWRHRDDCDESYDNDNETQTQDEDEDGERDGDGDSQKSIQLSTRTNPKSVMSELDNDFGLGFGLELGLTDGSISRLGSNDVSPRDTNIYINTNTANTTGSYNIGAKNGNKAAADIYLGTTKASSTAASNALKATDINHQHDKSTHQYLSQPVSLEAPQSIKIRGNNGRMVTLNGLSTARADMMCLAPSLFSHFPDKDADSIATGEIEEEVLLQMQLKQQQKKYDEDNDNKEEEEKDNNNPTENTATTTTATASVNRSRGNAFINGLEGLKTKYVGRKVLNSRQELEEKVQKDEEREFGITTTTNAEVNKWLKKLHRANPIHKADKLTGHTSRAGITGGSGEEDVYSDEDSDDDWPVWGNDREFKDHETNHTAVLL